MIAIFQNQTKQVQMWASFGLVYTSIFHVDLGQFFPPLKSDPSCPHVDVSLDQGLNSRLDRNLELDTITTGSF